MRIKNINITLKMPKKFDFLLHFSVLILVAFGTLMILSTNVGNSGGDSFLLVKVFIKQMAFIVISYILLTFLANNFTMRRAKKWIIYVGIVVVVLCLATQGYEEVLGSKAWLRFAIGGQEVTIQPAEFAKVFIIVAIAVYIEFVGKRDIKFWSIIRLPFIFFIACLIAIGLQKDIGSILVFGLITSLCVLLPTHRNLRLFQRVMKWILLGVLALSLFFMSDVGYAVIKKVDFLSDHIAVRVGNAINPFVDPSNNGYQLINGLYGFSNGGLMGVGLGNSIQKYGYLTQSDNDFILSIVVEELGIFGLTIVMLGYFIILQRLFYYAFRAHSEGYRIILIGTALYIFIHFALNVGGVTGLIPLTGVPLLFISSGGSSLMAVMIAIGIAQSIISRIRRQGSSPIEKEPQGVGGSLRKGRGETKIGG